MPLATNNLCLINSNSSLPGFLSPPWLPALPFPADPSGCSGQRCSRGCCSPHVSACTRGCSSLSLSSEGVFSQLLKHCCGSSPVRCDRQQDGLQQLSARVCLMDRPFLKLPGPGLSITRLFLQIQAWALPLSLSALCFTSPASSSVRSPRDQRAAAEGGQSSPVCLRSLFSCPFDPPAPSSSSGLRRGRIRHVHGTSRTCFLQRKWIIVLPTVAVGAERL